MRRKHLLTAVMILSPLEFRPTAEPFMNAGGYILTGFSKGQSMTAADEGFSRRAKTVQSQPISSPTYTRAGTANVRHHGETAPANITIEARVQSGVTVQADEHALSRILLNLVDNEIKYNEPGGRACFELRSQGDGAVIEIGNTGTEIPPELREAIFDRFVRVNTSRSRETGGSGLGLSICRELLAAHGGELQLRESQAGWTVFQLSI